jgi:soluble cytochrome b562
MSRIGSGGAPPKGPGGVGEQPADLRSQEGVQKFRETAGKEVPSQVVDSFSRAGAALESKLQAMGGKAIVGKLAFTNADLAVLAQTFAHVLKQNPGADRLKRARLFAQAIVKKKKFGKIFDNANEKDLEEMFDIIASQLDSSPRFAQLVDEVTESARKLNL